MNARTIHFQEDVFLLRFQLEYRYDAMNKLRDIGPNRAHAHLSRFKARQIEHVIDEIEQGVAGEIDRTQIFELFVVPDIVVLKQFAEADDRIERSTQFVADRGEEETLGAVGGLGQLHGALQFLFLPGDFSDVHRGNQEIRQYFLTVKQRHDGNHLLLTVDILFGGGDPGGILRRGLEPPLRRLLLLVNDFIVFHADDPVQRHSVFPGGTRVGGHDVVVQVDDGQRDRDVVHDLPLERNTVLQPVRLPPPLAGDQEQVHSAVKRVDVAAGERFGDVHEIEPEEAGQVVVRPDAGNDEGLDVLIFEDCRLFLEAGRRGAHVGDDDVALGQKRVVPFFVAGQIVGHVRFHNDSAARPFVFAGEADVVVGVVQEHIGAVGTGIDADGTEELFDHQRKVVFDADAAEQLVDDAFALDVAVQCGDGVFLLLLQLVLARNIDSHAQQQPRTVGLGDDVFNGSDDIFLAGRIMNAHGLQIAVGVKHFQVGQRGFGRERSFSVVNIAVAEADDPVLGQPEHFFEFIVADQIAEFVVHVFDENVSGQVVHDRFEHDQVVAVTELALPCVGDVMDYAAVLRQAVDFIGGFFHAHFEIALLAAQVHGVGHVDHQHFVVEYLVPFALERRDVGGDQPVFRGDHGVVFIWPEVFILKGIDELAGFAAAEIGEFADTGGVAHEDLVGAEPVELVVFIRHVAEHQHAAVELAVRIPDRGGAVRNMIPGAVPGDQVGVVGGVDHRTGQQSFTQSRRYFAVVDVTDDVVDGLDGEPLRFFLRVAGQLGSHGVDQCDVAFVVGGDQAVADRAQGQPEALRQPERFQMHHVQIGDIAGNPHDRRHAERVRLRQRQELGMAEAVVQFVVDLDLPAGGEHLLDRVDERLPDFAGKLIQIPEQVRHVRILRIIGDVGIQHFQGLIDDENPHRQVFDDHVDLVLNRPLEKNTQADEQQHEQYDDDKKDQVNKVLLQKTGRGVEHFQFERGAVLLQADFGRGGGGVHPRLFQCGIVQDVKRVLGRDRRNGGGVFAVQQAYGELSGGRALAAAGNHDSAVGPQLQVTLHFAQDQPPEALPDRGDYGIAVFRVGLYGREPGGEQNDGVGRQRLDQIQ